MKDFDVESKWWEAIDKYFSKELERNINQHRANERTYEYKLEAYQRTFPYFVCGDPTSIKALDQDEDNEARPSGTVQEKRCKLKNY